MVAQKKWLRHRGVLVGAALVAMAIGSSALAVWAVYRLPAPEHATGRDLLRWLVTRDLREESEETHRALVRQLEVYLQDTQDLGASAAEMNDERRTLLESNVSVLLPQWLHLGAERYAQLDPDKQPALLDEQLLLVERVADMSRLWNGSAQNTSTANPIFELVATIEEIIAAAPADDRAALDQYVRAMKLHWFTTADLSQISRPSLLVLSGRVEDELRGGLYLSSSTTEFDTVGSRQLWHNVDLLAEIWFHRHVDTYTALSATDRGQYMQHLVTDLTSWPIVKQQLTAPPAKTNLANPLSLLTNNPLTQLMKQTTAAERHINGWIRRAPQTSQPPMRQFVVAARKTIRKHYLQQFMPSLGNSEES
jgi:hypothetical protein